MESKEVRGISIDDKIVKVELNNIADYKSLTKDIYNFIKEYNIKFSLLRYDSKKNISFVINEIDKKRFSDFLDRLSEKEFFYFEIVEDFNCITLVGLGFSSSPGLSIEVFNLLSDNNIEVNQSVVSNLALTFLVNQNDTSTAANLLAEQFQIKE